MLRHIFGVLMLIAFGLLALYFFVGTSRIYRESSKPPPSIHVYDNPDIPLENIHITALYFVPEDRVDSQVDNWKKIIEQQLDMLVLFHWHQFQGHSKLTYSILPDPIIGNQHSSAYGTDTIHFGNPSEMKTIVKELEHTFAQAESTSIFEELGGESDTYEVIVIMYEGVGAASTENVSLVSRLFLTGDQYVQFGTTFLAHEFYHGLGVPEGYEITNISFADHQKIDAELLYTTDVMGRIRVPLEYSYLSRDVLSRMGL